MENETYFEKNVFAENLGVNVNDHTEKKNGLTYLSWAWGIAEVGKRYPKFNYRVKTFDGKPYIYDPLTGYMVFTELTTDGENWREMWLPVMDSKNDAMKAEPYSYQNKYGKEIRVAAATMFDINKTIMRCVAKNIAVSTGIGLYIYAGEDLPEEEQEQRLAERIVDKKPTQKPAEPRREAKKPAADKVDTPKQNAPVEPPVPSTQYTSNTKVLQFGNKSLEEIYAAEGINGIREAYKTAQALGDQYLMDLVKEYGTYRSAKQA